MSCTNTPMRPQPLAWPRLRLTPIRQLGNTLMTGALRAGIAPRRIHLPTLPGP